MFPADTSSAVPWFQRTRFLILERLSQLSDHLTSDSCIVPQRAKRERQKQRQQGIIFHGHIRSCLVQHRPIRFFIIQRWKEKTTGPSAVAHLGNPVAHPSVVIKFNAYQNRFSS